jgi:hypothetical protein
VISHGGYGDFSDHLQDKKHKAATQAASYNMKLHFSNNCVGENEPKCATTLNMIRVYPGGRR